ncbi:hypothetical protein ES705_17036 [subsurface metagenome]
MTSPLKDLIKYRLERAIETIEEAVLLANNNHWNASINRLYYACFYATNALLIKHDLSSSKHSGVRVILNREFVKKEIISKELAAIYNDLFEYRKESDYEDFYHVDPETVKQMIDKTKKYVNFIKKIIPR